MRIEAEQAAPLRHDVAPGRRLGRDADAEEREDRLDQDRVGADERALHDQRRDRVRQDVADEQQRRARAGHDGGLDIGLLAHRENDRAHQAHHARDFRHDDRDDDAEQPGAEQRDERDRQQDRRDRHQAVHQPHHDGVDPAHVAGDQADEEPDRDADRRDRDADDQRNPRAVDDAAVDVAAEAVGAHPVGEGARRAVIVADRLLDAGHAVAERRIDLRRAFRAEQRRREPDGGHQQQDDRAEDDPAVARQPRPQRRPWRGRGLFGGQQGGLGTQ